MYIRFEIRIIMIETVSKYEKLVSDLGMLIKNSKFKTEVFIAELGLAKATFYRKLKDRKFDVSEVKSITKILEVEKEIDKKLMKSEEDIREGRILTHEEALKRMN